MDDSEILESIMCDLLKVKAVNLTSLIEKAAQRISKTLHKEILTCIADIFIYADKLATNLTVANNKIIKLDDLICDSNTLRDQMVLEINDQAATIQILKSELNREKLTISHILDSSNNTVPDDLFLFSSLLPPTKINTFRQCTNDQAPEVNSQHHSSEDLQQPSLYHSINTAAATDSIVRNPELPPSVGLIPKGALLPEEDVKTSEATAGSSGIANDIILTCPTNDNRSAGTATVVSHSSNTQTSANNINTPIKKIKVWSDSQGRGLAKILNDRLSSLRATGTVKPSGVMREIICSDENLINLDALIIMAGTNDVNTGSTETAVHSMKDFFENIKQSNMKVFVTGVFDRHHAISGNCIDLIVRSLNKELKNLCDMYSNVLFIDTSNVPRNCFTSHGQHLNVKGKHFIANKILPHLETKNVCASPQQ